VRTKFSTLMGTLRVGRVAAALAVVVTSGLTASAGPVSAQPDDDGASPLSTSCSIATDRAKTYYAVVCDSDWPWENFTYGAWVVCSDGSLGYGGAHDSWPNGKWSRAQCPRAGTYYTSAGYDILD